MDHLSELIFFIVGNVHFCNWVNCGYFLMIISKFLIVIDIGRGFSLKWFMAGLHKFSKLIISNIDFVFVGHDGLNLHYLMSFFSGGIISAFGWWS